MQLYKLLNKDGTTPQQHYQWPLPAVAGKPGKWLPKITGELVACAHGYHVLRASDLLAWDGPALWEVECKGAVATWDNKCGVRTARLVRRVEAWNEKTLRLFAADCAERVLPLYEKEFSDDKRVRECIEAVRQYARGGIGEKKLAAAWAAGAAAWAAGAARAAWAAGAAAWAAGDAARAAVAARDARAARDAGDAARAAAWDAERQWQTAHLCEMLGIPDEESE